MIKNFPNADFRELRQFQSRFFECGRIGEFAQRDSRHFPAFPMAKRPEIIGRDLTAGRDSKHRDR